MYCMRRSRHHGCGEMRGCAAAVFFAYFGLLVNPSAQNKNKSPPLRKPKRTVFVSPCRVSGGCNVGGPPPPGRMDVLVLKIKKSHPHLRPMAIRHTRTPKAKSRPLPLPQ